MLEQKIRSTFGDEDPTGFGTGWWSGVLSAFFGVLALGAVVCLHYPQLLTSPELRRYYPMNVMRLLIQGLIAGAIVFGVVSANAWRSRCRFTQVTGLM
jgi:lathosterol oxidase